MSPPIGMITFESDRLRVTCRLGEGFPNQTQGFGGWEETERWRRKSVTTWKGRQPWRISIPLLFDRLREGTQGVSVEPDIRLLERLAGGGIEGTPPLIQFDSAGVVPHDKHDADHVIWVIDGLEFGAAVRNRYGNRVRAEVTVTVLEYVADEYLVHRAAANQRRDKRRSKRRGAKNKRYRVRKGDTLSKIAKRELGNHQRWREIGRLNGIRDPKGVKVGQILRLP